MEIVSGGKAFVNTRKTFLGTGFLINSGREEGKEGWSCAEISLGKKNSKKRRNLSIKRRNLPVDAKFKIFELSNFCPGFMPLSLKNILSGDSWLGLQKQPWK